ncbi:MAG: antibiotic biosynthesis monooxygenase [bacterium]|nr:MAG: antibiotic biosynthesis monooxygenase [bacterium]
MENKPVVATARLIVKPGEVERIKFTLKSLIVATRKEPGCISYDFYQSAYNKHLFISHEVWGSHEIFAKHLESPYILALLEQGDDLLVQPLEVMFLEPLG